MLKRGQGLPMETIVIVAIAVMVLVLLVLFATGSFSKLFSSQKILAEEVTPDQLSSFKIGCEQACYQAQQLSKNADGFNKSTYCSKNIKGMHCWNATVGVSCSKTFTTSTGGTQECKDNAVLDKCECV